MAVAAFKSSSRRGNLSTTTATSSHSAGKETTEKEIPPKKVPMRRSRSVSAFSRRTSTDVSSSSSEDFLNKRDNPLFWSSGSGSILEPEASTTSRNTRALGSEVADNRRGRSVTRNGGVGSNKGSGSGKETTRSLTRVDVGRPDRSVSRRNYLTSESEAEQECSLPEDLKIGNKRNAVATNPKKGGLISSSDIRSDQQSPFEPKDGFATTLSRWQHANWEDGVSTVSSLSGAEEGTIKAVSEQMKSVQGHNVEGDTSGSGIYETVRTEVRRAIAEIQHDLEIAIQRGNSASIATTTKADIPSDLVKPDAVELDLDIRREYAKKLEQSLERRRKLQADLAVEEHRGHELGRILKEILPDPKTPNVQKSRPGRKTSIERRKMSKRLEEEAMAYFDECVSLSTFDSSDFSSPEDPPFDFATPVSNCGSLPQASSSSLATNCTKSSLNTKQESYIQGLLMNGHDASGLTGSSSSKESNLDLVSPNSTDTFELQQDIRKYIRSFEKQDTDSGIARSNCNNLDEYKLQASAQSLLFDRVILKNKIESGSLLLCGGGMTLPFSSFASNL